MQEIISLPPYVGLHRVSREKWTLSVVLSALNSSNICPSLKQDFTNWLATLKPFLFVLIMASYMKFVNIFNRFEGEGKYP